MTSIKSLKASDLMRSDVFCLSPETSIESAINTFADLHISGAPVVDGARRLVGVLSASDVTQPEHVDGDRIDVGRGDWSAGNPGADDPDEVYVDKDAFSPEVFGEQTVGDWMSSGVVSVAPDASLRDVCRTMSDNEIHRVCVVQDNELLGLISGTDVVRCLAKNL